MRFDVVETIIGQTVRRDISRMVEFARGGLEAAARSIAETPDAHVAIVTGFFIRNALPPSPETDGLGGMAHLAAGLAHAGIPVTVITDAPCAKAVWAITGELPKSVSLEITSVTEDSVFELRSRLSSASRPVTHLIAIERVSPGSDGKPHREYGADMTEDTAPLHLLFSDAAWERPWVTIGIGDGGNEIGMANLPEDIVRDDIPNGSLIAAMTPADHLIVAGVSNWGGWGLLLATALARPDLAVSLLRDFTAEKDKAFLKAAVEVGQAVDDSRIDKAATPVMSVDRLPWRSHAVVLEQLKSVVAAQLDEAGAACEFETSAQPTS
jgi:D-glutamate cyclase